MRTQHRRRRNSRIYGLESFGVTLQQLVRLGSKRVVARIDLVLAPQIYPTGRLLKILSAVPAKERREAVGRWRRERLSRLLSELGEVDYKLSGSQRNPFGIELNTQARVVPRLRSLKNADAIWVTAIEGKRRLPSVPSPRLFAIKGLLIEKIEGQARGDEQVEERIVVLRADSEREAIRLAKRILKESEHVVLLTDGRYKKCQFVEILDVCECPDRDFDPEGTEVFYTFRSRRSQSATVWHPGGNG